MEIYSLKLFINLSETLHFGRTSKACHISPSALSRQIQRLEVEVGRELFERDNRQVQLTSHGTLFLPRAREIVARWDDALEEMGGEGRGLSGEIRIYGSVTACYSILPELIEKFRKTYPRVHIKLETGSHAAALEKVSSGELDVAVAAKPENIPPNLCFKRITETPLVFIAPDLDWPGASLLEDSEIIWEKLPFILPEKDLARDRVEAWFRETGYNPEIYAQVSGNEALLAMVGLGCGVGVIPELVLNRFPVSMAVKVLDVSPALQPYEVGIVTHRRKIDSPLVSAFWELIE
ncbi:MAG: HTH-type transcriptional activator IlvY [Spirochaetales bacterium]|nr:HTH-type transcriptional activator IlvY [Spirochaetales bacterium]